MPEDLIQKLDESAAAFLAETWMLASMAHVRVRAQMGRRRRSEGLILCLASTDI